MTTPVILYGVGATKAGTSWLYRWLSGHPECHLRGVKEVHYFDTAEAARWAKRAEELEAERTQAAAQGARASRLADLDDLIALFRAEADAAAYRAYLDDGRGGARVIGEVTPAYGLLPEARLRQMDSLGDARFLYILRDPVARLWSHVRMIARRRDPSGEVTEERAGRILARTLRGDEDHIMARGDYRGAMERLGAAIPAARRLVVFFEEMIFGDATARICGFLGIAPLAPLAAPVHTGASLPITPDQARAARAALAPQYDYVASAMGHLPPAWAATERV